jgi:hypothetical protein
MFDQRGPERDLYSSVNWSTFEFQTICSLDARSHHIIRQHARASKIGEVVLSSCGFVIRLFGFLMDMKGNAACL